MIRLFTPADRALFLAMSEEFYTSPAVSHDIPRSYHAPAFDEALKGELLIGIMLESEGVPAGYALLQRTYSREAGGICLWIDEVYLRPAFRGKGLGHELFAYAETLGASRLRLEVEPANVRAKKLYEALGFTPMPYLPMIKEL